MNKLLLLPVLVLCLLFSIAANALAADAPNLYVDTMFYGRVDGDNRIGDDDAQETYVGIQLPMNKLKLNFELQTGSWDQDPGDNDFDGYEIKGGYPILRARNLQLYATFSDYYRKFDSDQTAKGVLLGADAVYNLSNKTNLEGSIGFTSFGRCADQDASLLSLKAKVNYELAKDVYVSLGHRFYGFYLDNSDDEIRASGLTLGVNFKF
jgi:hypothetical protein